MSLYIEKNKNYFSSARNDILDLLPNFSQRVLEVGCGSGRTLEMLKEKNKCGETVGIELFESAAKEAESRVSKIYCTNIEQSEILSQIGKFDLILLLDVLEHLIDPWAVLNNLTKNNLSKNGKLIISLPNARHFSLVVPLLFGRFDYIERGIRDKTHLRFFTKNSAEKLLSNTSLEIESIKPTSLSIKLNSGKLNVITLGLLSGFIASQYIFLCKQKIR